MGSTVTARYPFSGKNCVVLMAEELGSATALPVYAGPSGSGRTEAIVSTSTLAGNYVWKGLGFITSGSVSETRTIEDIGTIGRRNIQQFAETRFECSGNYTCEFQNGRTLYLAIANNKVSGTTGAYATGIFHQDDVGSVTGLARHIIYEPEFVSGSENSTVIPEIPSFTFLTAFRASGGGTAVARRYVGSKIDSLKLNFTKDGAVKQDVTWKGAQVFSSQDTTANLPVSDYLAREEIFPPVFGKIYMKSWTYPTTTPTWASADDAALATTANLLGDVQNASFTITNNCEPLFAIGDTTARAMISQQRRYEGSISLAFEDETEHAWFLDTVTPPAGTWAAPKYAADRMNYFSLKYLYDNSSLGYTTASANYRRIELTLLGVKLKSLGTPHNVAGVIYQDMEWSALQLAPFNTSDNVGGIVLYDPVLTTGANGFHSVNPA